jgi:hypothetical protein
LSEMFDELSSWELFPVRDVEIYSEYLSDAVTLLFLEKLVSVELSIRKHGQILSGRFHSINILLKRALHININEHGVWNLAQFPALMSFSSNFYRVLERDDCLRYEATNQHQQSSEINRTAKCATLLNRNVPNEI